MAGRRIGSPGQLKSTHEQRESAASFCHQSSSLMNPECAAEFAAIAANYDNLSERMDRMEATLTKGLESLKQYLKEEYAQAIDLRMRAQSDRIDTANTKISALERAVTKLSRKVIYATGGVAMLTFLIGLAVALLPKLLGRL